MENLEDRPKFFYVTYPMPIEMAEAFPIPAQIGASEKKAAVPMGGEKDFEPGWYGNARFPEDE